MTSMRVFVALKFVQRHKGSYEENVVIQNTLNTISVTTGNTIYCIYLYRVYNVGIYNLLFTSVPQTSYGNLS